MGSRPLRRGLPVSAVTRLLGDNGHDERGDGTYRTYEFLVWDPAEGMRLAVAETWFRDGRLTRWGGEWELVADTWAKIRAGDPATTWAAGRGPEPTPAVRAAMIALILNREAAAARPAPSRRRRPSRPSRPPLL